MSSYPKWLYHPHKEAVVVPDEPAEKALGKGWFASPADFPKTAEPKKAPSPLTPTSSEETEPAAEKYKRK